MTQPFNPAGDGQPAVPAPDTTAAGSRAAGGTGPGVPLSIWPGLPAHDIRDGQPCGGPVTAAGRPPGHRRVLPPRRPGRRRRPLAGGRRGRGSRRPSRPGPDRRPRPGTAAARRPGGAAAAGGPRRRDGRAGHRRLARSRLLRLAARQPGRRARPRAGVRRRRAGAAARRGPRRHHRPRRPRRHDCRHRREHRRRRPRRRPGLRPAHRPGPRRHRRRPPRPRRP